MCPGALINTFWESGLGPNGTCSLSAEPGETCHQGRIPPYAAIVESAQEVQTAVQFAAKHNLRLVIRNTGHDGTGSSSGPDSFQVFTHRLSDITHHEEFRLTGPNTPAGPAVSVGAGVLIGDLYAYGGQNGFIVTGGDSATVGAAGGFIQGGGVPGFLGHTWGLAADNVLEFEVVTASVWLPFTLLPRLLMLTCSRGIWSSPTKVNIPISFGRYVVGVAARLAS